jgi:hypothetical protein
VRPDVFPVLASLTEVRARADHARAHGRVGVPALEFGGDLVIVLVIEDGETLTWVDQPLLDSLGADAFPRAVDNLRARTHVPLRLTRCSSPKVGVWVVGEDDGLGSGRLLLRDLWRPIKAKMPGELLVRVPTRSTVLCSMDRPQDMVFADHLALQLTETARKNDAPLVSSEWLKWTPEGWAAVEVG